MLSEQLHFVKGIDPNSDAFDGTRYTGVVDASQFAEVTFIFHAGVGVTGSSTFTVEASDNASPAVVTAQPFRYREVLTTDAQGTLTDGAAAGIINTVGSSRLLIIEVDTREIGDMPAAQKYLRVKAVESVNSPVIASCLIIGSGLRYKPHAGSAVD